MEIERKYLLDKLPFNLDSFEKAEIKQGYISNNPVLRIRQWNDRYILTIKTQSKLDVNPLLAREEFEVDLTKDEFNSLQAKVETSTISKTRYLIPIENNLIAELDVYFGELKGLLTVEVEFENIEQAESFTSPTWFGKDVTFDKKYSNNHLSRHGLPI